MLGQTNMTGLAHKIFSILRFWVGGEIKLLLCLYLVSWIPYSVIPLTLTITAEPVKDTDAKLDDGVFGAIH